jgi:hypothetical protein
MVDVPFGLAVGILGVFFALGEFAKGREPGRLKKVAVRGLASGLLVGGRIAFVVGVVYGIAAAFPGTGALAPRLAGVPMAAARGGAAFALFVAIPSAVLGLIISLGLEIARPTDPSGRPPIDGFRWGRMGRGAVKGARAGLLPGVVLGILEMALAAANTSALPLVQVMIFLGAGAFLGLISGAFAGAVAGGVFLIKLSPGKSLLSRLADALIAVRDARPVEGVHWSWRRSHEGAAFAGRLAVGVTLLTAPIFAGLGAVAGAKIPFLPGVLDAAPSTLPEKLSLALIIAMSMSAMMIVLGGFIVAILFAPLGFMEGMLVRDELRTSSMPNIGVRRSSRVALTAGITAAAGFGAVAFCMTLMMPGAGISFRSAAIGNVIFAAQAGFVIAALRNGGVFVIQHYAVRAVLWVTGAAPLRYIRFLDSLTGSVPLLHRVGGSYLFVHRFVLEHFAAKASG